MSSEKGWYHTTKLQDVFCFLPTGPWNYIFVEAVLFKQLRRLSSVRF